MLLFAAGSRQSPFFICVYLIYSIETLKSIPLVPNPLDTNHEHDKPEAQSSYQMSTVEGLYMTSDIGNQKPPHPHKPSVPQKVRYY